MPKVKIEMSQVIKGIRDNCNAIDQITIEDTSAFWRHIDLNQLSSVAVKLLAVKYELSRAIRAEKIAARS